MEDNVVTCNDSGPVFSSWIFLLGKGLLFVDPQEVMLLLVSGYSGLSLTKCCLLSKAEVCGDVNSEKVVSDVAVVIGIVFDVVVLVVVVDFLFLEDEIVESMLPSFFLNFPFLK